MSQKKPLPKPVWTKNTYFWIAIILTILGLIGLPFVGGDAAIRDPGQKKESNLFVLYFAAAAIMFVNGWISHRQTVQQFEEEEALEPNTASKPRAIKAGESVSVPGQTTSDDEPVSVKQK